MADENRDFGIVNGENVPTAISYVHALQFISFKTELY